MQQKQANGDLLDNLKKIIINFPLKSKMYVNMLMSVEDVHHNVQIPKEIKKKYQSFLSVFRNLSSQERGFFISKSISFIEANINNRSNHYEPDIKQIQTSCDIKTKFLTMSYWEKKNFKYQYNSLTIKLSGNKKIQTINLKNYLVRKSKSQNRSLTLESYDSKIPQRLQKITIKFANNSLFLAIYNNIRDTIINISNKRIQILLKQQQQNIQSRFGQQSLQNGLTFLDHKTINEYFDKKQKQLSKLKRYRQKIFCIHSQKRFKILNSSKKTSCYYLQYIFPKIALKQHNQQYQKCLKIPILQNGQHLETFTNNISSNYYKWIINNKEYESIMIRQKLQKVKYYQQIMKSINSIFQLINIQFINIIIYYDDVEDCFKLDIQMIIKFAHKNQENKSRFVIRLFQSMVNRQFFQANGSITSMFNFQESKLDIRSSKNSSQDKERPRHGSFIIQPQSKNRDLTKQQKFHTAKKQRQTSINQIQSISSRQQEAFYTIQDIDDDNDDNDDNINLRQNLIMNNYTQVKVITKKENICSNNSQKDKQYLIHNYQQKPLQNYPKKYIEAHYLKVNWKKSEKGGVICIDEKAITQQKRVFKHIFNQLLKMRNALNFSLPIQICKDQSALVSIARNLTFAPTIFQNHANLTPLERIKKIVIFQISMASQSLNCKKPLNPVLGQTYQGLIDGCPVYMEQISHHPPITSIYFIGRGYKIYGTVGVEVQLRLNYIKGVNDKTLTIQFDNKQKVQFSLPTMIINGMIYGERSIYFEGKNFIIDYQNRLIAQTKFNSSDNIKLKNKQKSPDYLDGCIYTVQNNFLEFHLKGQKKKFPRSSEKINLSTYYGQWNGQLFIDQQKIFDFYENYPFLMENYEFNLQSDSINRTDVIALRQGNEDKAQNQKIQLEQNQRADKKLREAFIKQKQKIS